MLTRELHTNAPRHASFSWFAAAFVVVAFGCGSPATPPDAGRDDAGTDMGPVDAGPRPMAPVEGELNLLGCTPTASDIHVRLRPLVAPFVGSRTTATPAPPARATLDAVVSATTDPHVFTFGQTDLVAADLYQVGVTVDDTACANLGWRGPRAGLIMPGGAPARFDGPRPT